MAGGVKKIKKTLRIIKKMFFFLLCKDFKSTPIAVKIETSNMCNAKCWFCPNSHLQRKKEIMSDETFNTIVRRLREEKISVIRFDMHNNGEPLFDEKLFDRIECLRSFFPSSYIRFASNFSMASDEIIEKILRSPLDEVTISINAMDSDEYYSIMKLPYEKTMENIERFMRRKQELNSPITVVFSIVAREDNKDVVEKFKEKYETMGKVRTMYLGEWVNKEKPDKFDEKKKRSRICRLLYLNLSILSNGDFALCDFDAEGIIPMNVSETSLREAWCSPYFNKIRLHHLIHGKTNEECINCSVR